MLFDSTAPRNESCRATAVLAATSTTSPDITMLHYDVRRCKDLTGGPWLPNQQAVLEKVAQLCKVINETSHHQVAEKSEECVVLRNRGIEQTDMLTLSCTPDSPVASMSLMSTPKKPVFSDLLIVIARFVRITTQDWKRLIKDNRVD